MKTTRFLQLTLVTLLTLLSSCKEVHTNDGIYEGILTAADCPGIYVLLAVNGDKYELLEKYIAHPETFISYGSIKRNGSTLYLDNDMQFNYKNDTLSCQNINFRQISTQTELPDIYTSQLLKENQSGEDATIKLYTQTEQQYAHFYFRDTEYILKRNLQNDSINEYTNTKNHIQVSLSILPSSSLQEFIFRKDTTTFLLTQLTPTNCNYHIIGKKEDDIPLFWDVTYYNDGQQAFVKLLNTSLEHCYTLPQTEASAKTATYTDGIVEWQLHNNQSATLIIHNKKYQYKEEQ